GELGGQGDGCNGAVGALQQTLEPATKGRIALGEAWQSRACAVDQQHPQVTVTPLADAEQPRLTARRCLARCQPQPCRQATATSKRAGVAKRRHKRRGGEDSDPRDRDQAAGSVIGACPLGKLVIEGRDPLVQQRRNVSAPRKSSAKEG